MSNIFTGHCSDDYNGNGIQDGMEPDLAGITFQALDLTQGAIVGAATSDAGGLWSIALDDGLIGHVVEIVHNAPFHYYFTSGPASWVYGVGGDTLVGGPTDGKIGLARIECFGALTHWVKQVCWVPGLGVRATYWHKQLGAVTVAYPGTTRQDYLDWKAALPNCGKWAYANYRHRPYVFVGLGIPGS
jgi:hypothetical protein